MKPKMPRELPPTGWEIEPDPEVAHIHPLVVNSAAEQVTQLKQRIEVAELLQRGMSRDQIAAHLDLPAKQVTQLILDVHSTITDNYIATVDTFRALTLMRMEKLYRVASAHAFGEPDPEMHFDTVVPKAAQQTWFKVVLSILKAQSALLDADIKQARKRDEEAGANRLNFSRLESVTITSSNTDMINVARASLANGLGHEVDTDNKHELLGYLHAAELPIPAPAPTPSLDNLSMEGIMGELAKLQSFAGEGSLLEEDEDDD